MKENESASYQPPEEGFISTHLFKRLLVSGKIVDGRAGGFILGRPYDEGGILAIYKLGTGFVIRGKVEGGEFALNWKAATANLHRLKMMNCGMTHHETTPIEMGIDPPTLEQIIITSARPDDRIVYFGWSQVIVNKEAARKHIVELVEMNSLSNPFISCDLRKLFGCVPGTEDGWYEPDGASEVPKTAVCGPYRAKD